MTSVPLENPNTMHNWKTKFNSNQLKSNYQHMAKAAKNISLSQFEKYMFT